MNRSKWHAPAALAAVFAMSIAGLGAGCGLDDDADDAKEASAEIVGEETTVPDDGGGATTTTTQENDASGSGGVDVSGVDLPRRVTYAGFEITVDEIEATTDSIEGPGVTL